MQLPSHRRHAEAGPRQRGPAALVVVAAAAQPVPVRLGRRLGLQRLATPEAEPPQPPPEGLPVLLQRRKRQRERGFRVRLRRRPWTPGEEWKPEAPGRHRGADRGVHGEEGAEEGIEIGRWRWWGGFPFVWAGIRVAVKASIAESLLLVTVGCAG